MKCINNSYYSCSVRKQVLPLWVHARCSSIETQNSVSIVLQLHAALYNHPQFLSTLSPAVMSFKCETLIIVNTLIETFSCSLSIHFSPFSHDLSNVVLTQICFMTVACLLALIDERRHDIQTQSHFANQGSWKVLRFLEAHLMGTTSWVLLEGPMFRPVVLKPL